MSTETEPAGTKETDIEALAESLGRAISDLPEYQTFLDAKDAVEADEETQEKVAEFEAIREEYMQARQRGQATGDDLRDLQRHQEELHEMPLMSDFLQAQNDLELRLQELNEYISEPLAIDFGEKAGGCCED